MRLLGGVREDRIGIHHVSLHVASKAELPFETFFLLFWSEFFNFHCIDIHGVWVLGHCSRRGEGLEGLCRPPASLGNLFYMVPLVLEVNGL